MMPATRSGSRCASRPARAYDKVQRAAALTGRLSDTLAALGRGEISGLQAAAIATTLEPLDDEVTATVQATVLATAPEQTLAETKRTLRRAVIAADPDGAAAPRRAGQAPGAPCPATRSMTGWPSCAPCSPPPTPSWSGPSSPPAPKPNTSAAQTTACPNPAWTRCAPTPSSTPSSAPSPTPTPAPTPSRQRRRPAVGRSGGPGRVQLRVTIDLPTLLGLADNPAELAGHGPIPPHLARELAGDADWIRFTTDPQTGELLDLDPRRYRPSRRLAAFIRARQPVCGWPGCNQPSERCDLDHSHDFDKGGQTRRANLGPFCRQHHNAKTHGRWHYRRHPDGAATLTSPLRKTYTLKPPWRRANQ